MDVVCYWISTEAIDGTSEKVTIGLWSAPPALGGQTRFDVQNKWRTPIASVRHMIETAVTLGRCPHLYDPSTGKMLAVSSPGVPFSIKSVKTGWSAPCFMGSEYHRRVCGGLATHVPPWDAPGDAPTCCSECLAKFMSASPWSGQPQKYGM